MSGRRWQSKVDEGRVEAYAGGPRFEGVMRPLRVSGCPGCIEVSTTNGAGEPGPMVFRQLVMELVEDVLRRREVAMARGPEVVH